MQYRLSSLLVALAIGPPILAVLTGLLGRGQHSDCGPDTAAQAQIANLRCAVLAYGLNIGELPFDLNARLTPPADLLRPQRWSGPYVKELPVDPWGNVLQYKVLNRKEQEFRIWSCGPDGISGSKDDIVGGPSAQ